MSQILPQNNEDQVYGVAESWGHEDALEGIRPRAYLYYAPNSPQEIAYLHGYQAATELLFDLTGIRTARQLGIHNENFQDALTEWELIDYDRTF